MSRRLPVILAMVGALALAGCGEGDPDTAQTEPETPTPTSTATPTTPDETSGTTPDDSPSPDETSGGTSGEVADLALATCEAERYAIGYPEDWNTNDPEGEIEACRVFHPGEIDLEAQTDMDLHYAASVYVDPVAYEDARGGEPGGEIVEERDVTVDGRDAHVREVLSDGRAMMPEGETYVTWIVDLDGEIFVATTSTVGETDYERDKQILERMVTEELTFTDGGPRTAVRSDGERPRRQD